MSTKTTLREVEHESATANSREGAHDPVTYTYQLDIRGFDKVLTMSGGTVTFEAQAPLSEEMLDLLDTALEARGYRRV